MGRGMMVSCCAGALVTLASFSAHAQDASSSEPPSQETQVIAPIEIAAIDQERPIAAPRRDATSSSRAFEWAASFTPSVGYTSFRPEPFFGIIDESAWSGGGVLSATLFTRPVDDDSSPRSLQPFLQRASFSLSRSAPVSIAPS